MDEINMDEMVDEPKKRSIAKSIVAQQKPRDDKGRFLSGEALQAYRINKQAQMQQMEREKLNRMLGRGIITNEMRQDGVPQTPLNNTIPSNFSAILAANKPGAQFSDDEKLAMLLGKKKRVI